ncbi:MAG: nascent polypeptide-associated complex protein [Methanomassiliicoccales archaeon]
MRGVNPRQVKQAMKRMGIETEELKGVTEVIIRTKDAEYRIQNAEVTIMKVQGQKTFQIIGEEKMTPLTQKQETKSDDKQKVDIPEEDIELVMSQTGASREKAIAALKACDGQPAEAIIKLLS